MRNAGLEETQTGIKIARRNINNLRYADDSLGFTQFALGHQPSPFNSSPGYSYPPVTCWLTNSRRVQEIPCFLIFSEQIKYFCLHSAVLQQKLDLWSLRHHFLSEGLTSIYDARKWARTSSPSACLLLSSLPTLRGLEGGGSSA